MEEIKGEIYVESDEGKGSVFTCVIPLKIALLDDENKTEISPKINSTNKSKVESFDDQSQVSEDKENRPLA